MEEGVTGRLVAATWRLAAAAERWNGVVIPLNGRATYLLWLPWGVSKWLGRRACHSNWEVRYVGGGTVVVRQWRCGGRYQRRRDSTASTKRYSFGASVA